MNIKLIVVSKTDIPYLQTGIDEYVGRLKHYCDFELVVIPALKNLGKASAEEVKEREGQLILKQLEKVDCTVLLDEHGKEYTSVGFSAPMFPATADWKTPATIIASLQRSSSSQPILFSCSRALLLLMGASATTFAI